MGERTNKPVKKGLHAEHESLAEKKAEAYYRKITDNTPVIIWITNSDAYCTYLNKKWYDYTGQLPEAGLGFGWLENVHPEDRNRAREIFLEANEKKVSFEIELRLKLMSGQYRWNLDSGLPKFDEDGNFEGYIGSVVDIHERKENELVLRKSESWYKTYAEAMPQMAFIADAQGNVIYFNQRWYEYVGQMDGTEGWGWKDKSIHHHEDLNKTIEKWNHSLKTGEPYEIEYRLRRYDGKYRWHLGRAMPTRDKDGNIELWIGTNTDIHKQKKAEEALIKSRERFRLFSKATNDAIWDWNLQNNKLWWNETAYMLFGYKNDDIGQEIGWWYDHIHPDDKQRVVKGIHSIIDKGGTSWSDEYRFRCSDGSYMEVLDRGYIIHDVEGNPVRMVGSLIDITERKNYEKALVYEREKLSAIIENMGVGVGVTDPKGNTLSLNKAALKIHDFDSEAEMLAQIESYKELFELQFPDGRKMPFEEWPSLRVMRGEIVQDYEVKLVNLKTNSSKFISYTAVPLHDDRGVVLNFIFTLTDLTDRKKSEEKLNFQKSLLEAQQEVSPLGILVVSPDGKMLTYNRRMVEIWGFPEEIMDRKIDEIALNLAKEQLIDPDGFINKVMECYEKQVYNHEKLYFKDGKILDRYGSPVRGEDGSYYGYVWFFMDITEREKLTKQKDDFLGIASHELKTPVAIMKGYINMLERLLMNKDATVEAELLKKADNQIVRLTNLINDLLDVTKIESGKMRFEQQEYDFDHSVEEVVEAMRHITSHRLIIRGNSGRKIIGDKDRTGQVIANLISNAVKYSDKESQIIVKIRAEDHKVSLSVQDYGIGIAEEDLPKVFDRFFRVRSSGNHSAGLGLGLYISHEIIKRQNGEIWVESKLGQGSVFGFSLPANKSQ